jgi:hypothetical protein
LTRPPTRLFRLEIRYDIPGMQASLPRSAQTAILVCSTFSLLPLLSCWPQFRLLLFFHDDWELLDSATRLGFGRWLAEPFLGEGVFPLFKLLWFGAVRLTGGSYFGMILLLWITHVAVCVLFGSLLARSGLSPASIAFALLTFGLSWTNLETLGWSMQWNSQLAIVFFLAAWHFLLGARTVGCAAACSLCLLASGLCSSRGIISGLVLAIFVLVQNNRQERVRLCILCLAPTALLVAVIWLLAPHRQAPPGAALLYGLDYLLMNPLYMPLPILRHVFGAGTFLVCGALKAAVFIWAFRKAGPSLRPLLSTLVALDLVLAASLGYGRWSTGLATTTSSRYQYIPLLCFGPMAGILVAHLRTGARVAVLILCAFALAVPWKRHAEQWGSSRGSRLRAALEQAGPTEHFDPSSLTAARARELVRLYGLH